MNAMRGRSYSNLFTRTQAGLDLTQRMQVEANCAPAKPDYVLSPSPNVGGTHANDTDCAEFLRASLAIETYIIHSIYLCRAAHLLVPGSCGICPRNYHQPVKEDYLTRGRFEANNRSCAVTKRAGID